MKLGGEAVLAELGCLPSPASSWHTGGLRVCVGLGSLGWVLCCELAMSYWVVSPGGFCTPTHTLPPEVPVTWVNSQVG